MSLVGPRPLLMRYLDRYNDEEKKRHWVKPGITGWAQVNGRNSISWHEKFAFDLEYVQNIGPTIDFRVLWMTLAAVFKGKGVNADAMHTMPEFMGHESKKH
jgi:lipopolysaccharide/colanic/teichoic acid biosynthesis glycosyltransferase